MKAALLAALLLIGCTDPPCLVSHKVQSVMMQPVPVGTLNGATQFMFFPIPIVVAVCDRYGEK